jgi:hypothetical protein
MKTQDYKSHKRFVPFFHFFLFGLVVVTFIGSVVNLFNSFGNHDRLYNAALLVSISTILVFLFFFTRIFALKAQNRAIRAEETLRHLLLTGKGFDNRLTMGQVIALRFAPDEEFVDLAKYAADKNLSPNEIKRTIKNWKADHHRA